MNPNLIILKQSAPKFFSKRKTIREEFKLGVTTTYIMILAFIWILGIYYVWSLNVNATNSYELRTLEIETRALNDEKKLLEFQISRLENLSSLKKRWLKYKQEIKNIKMKYLVKKDSEQYVFNDINDFLKN